MAQLDLSLWSECTLGQVVSLGWSGGEQVLSGSRHGQFLNDDGAYGNSLERVALLRVCQQYAQDLHQRLQAAVSQWRSQSWELMQPGAQRDAHRAALLQLLR
jgi:hypothetical protein